VGNLKDFYATAAQACFTVLSVWWVILSLNFKEWVRDPHRRLMVYDVSLYFLLPGLMSLVSLLAIGVPEIWRVAFALAGIIGAIESVVLPIRRAPHGRAGAPVRAADWLSFVLFSLIALVAAAPSLVETVGIGLRPLELEGALISGILVIGFSLAWLMFVTAATGEEQAADETPAESVVDRSPGDAPAPKPRPRPAVDA
jgi:hypothetical protein